MKKLILLYALIFFSIHVRAQLQLNAYTFPSQIPPQYNLDAKKEYNELLKSNMEGMTNDQKELFAEEMTYRKVNAITSGQVYIGWNEMEEYLNAILQKVIPENQKNNKLLHIYISRDPDCNAYAIHDGTLFFTISILAELENEAAIAAIIGHEFTHYLNEDVRKSFIMRYDLNAKKNRNKNHRKEDEVNAFYNRQQERTADSLGAVLAAKAGFDINYGISNFYTFALMEDYEKDKGRAKQIYVNESDLKKKSDSARTVDGKLMASHPDLVERMDYYGKYVKAENLKDCKNFIISTPEKFKLLQQQARLETLKILLDEYDYRECAKRAFSYYLFDPDNEAFQYYLLESLRRYFILKPKIITKAFLTDDYKSGLFQRGEGILHNLHALVRDSTVYKKIKATALLDSKVIEFETYDEAFNYFADIALEKKYAEALFTIALRNNDSIPMRNDFLKQYLGNKNILYADYAKALLENKFNSAYNQNKQKLFLFSDISFIEDHRSGYQTRFILEAEETPGYYKDLKELLAREFKDRNVILLDDLNKTNMQKSNAYKSLIIGSAVVEDAFSNMYMEESEENKVGIISNFFNLNPNYWYLMRDEKIKAIETVYAVSFIDKTTLKKGRYEYAVYYYSFDPTRTKNIFYTNEDLVITKMVRSNFLNSVYKNLKFTNSLKD